VNVAKNTLDYGYAVCFKKSKEWKRGGHALAILKGLSHKITVLGQKHKELQRKDKDQEAKTKGTEGRLCL
jgi:hypothetical protein